MDLSLLLLVFSFIFTVASRLLHLYSTDDETYRLKMKSFSTLRDTQRGSLFLKTMVCFSGCLMSSASLQKLFCGIYSALKCSFDEFVREKVVSLSYSSTILGPPLPSVSLEIRNCVLSNKKLAFLSSLQSIRILESAYLVLTTKSQLVF